MCSNNSRLVLCLCATLLAVGARASTFLWDPNNEGSIDTWKRAYPSFANPPICVPIPTNMTLCYGIKYTEMRLPNLLHHDSLNEVIHQSETWIQLTKLKCHSDTQLFLCSLFTPVCLDQTIPPCRSLCESVKLECEPFMLKHGYSWPSMMRCDQFPMDNNMCIQTQSNKPPVSTAANSRPKDSIEPPGSGSVHTDERANQTNADARADEAFYQRLLSEICRSHWVIKSGQISNLLRSNQVRIKKYKLIIGNLAPQAPIMVSFNESSNAIGDLSVNFKKKQKFVVVGNIKDGALAARVVVNWNHKTAQIKRALKKAKTGDGCGRKSRPNQSAKSKRRQHRQRELARA